jgi:hypothetical protein
MEAQLDRVSLSGVLELKRFLDSFHNALIFKGIQGI